eukprot:scaffold1025_cov378-Pavlova_lutheri.AAC.2
MDAPDVQLGSSRSGSSGGLPNHRGSGSERTVWNIPFHKSTRSSTWTSARGRNNRRTRVGPHLLADTRRMPTAIVRSFPYENHDASSIESALPWVWLRLKAEPSKDDKRGKAARGLDGVRRTSGTSKALLSAGREHFARGETAGHRMLIWTARVKW